MQEPLERNEPTARSIADHLYALMQQYDPKFMERFSDPSLQVSQTEQEIRNGYSYVLMEIEAFALYVKDDERATATLQEQAADLLQEIDQYKEKNHSFSIYQLKDVPETRQYHFVPYKQLQKEGKKVDPTNYDLIYTAPLQDLTTLDDIYRTFNTDHPVDFTGHSLSVSDIVVEKFSDREIAYYCDMFGFTEVPEFLEKEKQHSAKSYIESELKAAGIKGIVFENAKQWEVWMEANRMNDKSAPATKDQKDMLSVLVVEPGKTPYGKQIKAGLESLQKEVGGYIEAVYPFDDPVALICNEEGKINGLPLNRALRDENEKVYDIISGTFMVVGLGEEDFSSLSDDLMKKYNDYFKAPERFIVGDGKIVVLKPKELEPTRMADQLAAATATKEQEAKQDEMQHHEPKNNHDR